MIESIIFPETDHSLCLNCQVGKGNPHLCSSCQWYASGHLVEMRNQRLVDQKLDEIQHELTFGTKSNFKFDVTTNSVSDLFEKLSEKKRILFAKGISFSMEQNQILTALQALKETGLNHSRYESWWNPKK